MNNKIVVFFHKKNKVGDIYIINNIFKKTMNYD